ncbi:MAG: hypothetical protein R3C26_26580 [Calditrichia bacterium]
MNYVLAQSLGLSQVTFIQLLLVIPITFVMGLLPSVNGLGVRESGYVVLLSNVFHSTQPPVKRLRSLLNTSVPVLVSLSRRRNAAVLQTQQSGSHSGYSAGSVNKLFAIFWMLRYIDSIIGVSLLRQPYLLF